jgi:putative PEP-CTERM system TPR-repeat lipoprotein
MLMMRSSNCSNRLPAIVALPMLLVFGLMSACGLAMDNQDRLDRAQDAYEDGDFQAAIIDVKHVLQEEPDNAEARVLLGRASLRGNDPESAEKEFRRALDLNVPLQVVAIDLGQAMLRLGQFNEILSEIDEEVAEDEAQRIAILKLRGDAMMGLELWSGARDWFRAALELDDADLEARLGVIRSYIAEGDLAGGREELDAFIAGNPDYIPALIASGSLNQKMRSLNAAEADYEKALGLAEAAGNTEQQAMALAGLVDVALGKQNLSAARSAVDRLVELAPEAIRSLYYSARVSYFEGNDAEAQAQLTELLSRAPGVQAAELLLGAVNLRMGNLGQAEMYLSSVLAADPGNNDARRFLAQARLQQNRAGEAADMLEPILREDTADLDALALALQAGMESGEVSNTIQLLEENLAKNPDDTERKLDLISAYLAVGRVDDAEALLLTIEETDDAAGPRRGLVAVVTAMQKGRTGEALDRAEQLVQAWPENAEFQTMLGRIALRLERYDTARSAFQAAQKLSPDNSETYIDLARVEIATGNVAAAKSQLMGGLDRLPGGTGLMMTLGRIAAGSGEYEDALTWFTEAAEADPNALEPRILLVRLHMQQGDFRMAADAAAVALDINPQDAETHNLLGLAQRGIGELSDAANSFEKASNLDIGRYDYRLNAAATYVALDRLAEAESILKRNNEVPLENVQASIFLAIVKSRQGDPEAAMAIAKQLQETYPENAAPVSLEAELLLVAEDYAGASDLFDEAMRMDPDEWRLAYRAYQVRRAGGIADPQEPLLAFLAINPENATIRNTLAEYYRESGDMESAASAWETVLEHDPEHVSALNNLAMTYLEDDAALAEELAIKAYALAPDNGLVADTLGWVQINNGKLEQGIATLQDAVQLSEGIPEIRYHLAVGLAKSGRTQEAEQILKEILASNEEFAEREQAMELLTTL